MTTNFLIKALTTDSFHELMLKNNDELKLFDAAWFTVDAEPGYPCRVSLTDAKIGERVLALSFCHHNVNSPYKASGAIFVRENAPTVKLNINEVPKMLRHRLLSVRAYNSQKLMIEAEVAQGTELESTIGKQFQNSKVEYIHIHNANQGCFNCSVHRA
ncbi:DUF1203 domain-containing protein [Pseudoalteromonas sp. SR41-8]|uniref:DUF1203 domain-containing protein n=1 Tax=Pseudoalteromonas rhizosphaerae TaxID=2518973 RepID=A0ABW8L1N3_9GAMM|nr:DUF1203 domain-containing protein [Pseudoalteromonas sp. SR41-8]MBB1311088.1 DUF1203 domain-containing protein [Pseudoalteromonas sp. SR41-8]